MYVFILSFWVSPGTPACHPNSVVWDWLNSRTARWLLKNVKAWVSLKSNYIQVSRGRFLAAVLLILSLDDFSALAEMNFTAVPGCSLQFEKQRCGNFRYYQCTWSHIIFLWKVQIVSLGPANICVYNGNLTGGKWKLDPSWKTGLVYSHMGSGSWACKLLILKPRSRTSC